MSWLLLVLMSSALTVAHPTNSAASLSGGTVADLYGVSSNETTAVANPANSGSIQISEHSGCRNKRLRQWNYIVNANYDNFYHQQLLDQGFKNWIIMRGILRLLGKKDLGSAAQVSRHWYHQVEQLRKLRNLNDIIILGPVLLGCNPEQAMLLKRYAKSVRNGSGQKEIMWRPKLTMIFRIQNARKRFPSFRRDVMNPVLQKSRVFGASRYCQTAIDINFKHSIALTQGVYDGLIFPEALLERSDVRVDIIFPPVDLLSDDVNSFTAEMKRKQLHEVFFGKKANENPVKCAIVMSRRIPEDKGLEGSYRRAYEVCRFLKSLPEATNMVICVIHDYDDISLNQYDPKFSGPVAVIVFCGQAVHATACFLSEQEIQEDSFQHWKETGYKCLSNATQTIGFCITETEKASTHNCNEILGLNLWWMSLYGHGNVFGLQRTQTNVAVELDENRRFRNTAFILVGFE